ncbi:ankyrin repeat domain-containing protein 39 isoform X3 [Melitaea cinxia]|uniref:ankyrin repeat domain-containing protein 39 isoform X3 n=1 Tax=Melitaea cinxia TaxID=113334 RepID=UPI001E26EF38|nr:ankyrin repeat domain-containing protein 39 isoform X3 [Melitaea cinxia]
MDHKSGCNHSNCNITSPNESVRQTLSEMDWERGIWNAAFTGDKGRVQLLIDKAKNTKELVNSVDNSGYTALHYAARNGHEDICRILLQYGGLIDAPTRSAKSTPLHKAAVAGMEQGWICKTMTVKQPFIKLQRIKIKILLKSYLRLALH